LQSSINLPTETLFNILMIYASEILKIPKFRGVFATWE